ncbi:MAG: energy transducer TonB [Gammaproteobacteria bacterium]
MNSADAAFVSAEPRLGRERLLTTLIFALLAHGILILGIGFIAFAPGKPQTNEVEITLARSKPAQAPQRAAYLARINQRGPGNTRRHLVVDPPGGSPDPYPNPGPRLAQSLAAALPNPALAHTFDATEKSRLDELVTTRSKSPLVAQEASKKAGEARPLFVMHLVPPADRRGIARSNTIQLPRLYGPHPKAGTRAVNAHAALAAPYLLAWQQRIEQIGTTQYTRLVPPGVKRGRLTLAVTLAADGSVRSLSILDRSRQPALNAAALKIIRLAAPFPPFPPTLAAHAKTLTFTYRWHFIRGTASGGTIGIGGNR